MDIYQEDRDYIMNAIRYMFPSVKVTDADIESSWAGVRPLIHEDGKIHLKFLVRMKCGFRHRGL